MTAKVLNTLEYNTFFESIAERIRHSRAAAATSLNRSVVTLYWQLGRAMLERQAQLDGERR